MNITDHLRDIRERFVRAAGKIDEALKEIEFAESKAKEIPAIAHLDELTKTEKKIFDLMGQGLEIGEIAEQLKNSRKTIETHRDNIRKKLGCATSQEVIHLARTQKL